MECTLEPCVDAASTLNLILLKTVEIFRSQMSSSELQTVFITGATGFIGRYVLRRLVASGSCRLLCLTRNSNVSAAVTDGDQNVEWITGEIVQPATYVEALAQSSVVIHLAAATGAADSRELREVNEIGTETLLSTCKRVGIDRIVFASSIAVTGDDIAHYPYARTKLAAENAVRDSGLDFAILRPTIVINDDAPNWRMLQKLACLPVVPLFGGGKANVQPVDVLDTARALELLIGDEIESGHIIELGGPETLPFSEFLARIRMASGRTGFLSLSIPVIPARVALGIAERVLGDRTPVRPGQLSPFVNDGVAKPNAIYELLRPRMLTLDELLQRIVRADRHR